MRLELNYENVKPFLKWAGGKTQLLTEIENRLPEGFSEESITFFEPFLGSGAVLFWAIKKFPNIKKFVVNDINEDLVNTYLMIKNHHLELIEKLMILQEDFYSFGEESEERKLFYYDKRKLFNQHTEDKINQASLFIFFKSNLF